MKKLLLTCAAVAIGLGLCSIAKAIPTTSPAQSNQTEPAGDYKVKDDPKDPDFFLEDWLYWLMEHLFGYDRGDDTWVYKSGSGNGGSDGGSGDSGWDGSSGDGGWDGDWDGDWDAYSGDGGWDGGSGSDYPGGGGSGTCPIQPVPAPGAVVLGGIGLSVVGWLRRRRIL